MTIDDLGAKLDALAAQMHEFKQDTRQRFERIDSVIDAVRKATNEGFLQVNQRIQDLNRHDDPGRSNQDWMR